MDILLFVRPCIFLSLYIFGSEKAGVKSDFLTVLALPCISQIFFLSILWKMKFFVVDFSRTMQDRMVIFGSQVHDALLYRGILNQSSPAYSSLYCPIFFPFIL